MLPARVLTVGGSSGPATRADVLNAITAFELVYNVAPAHMTVTPEGLDRLAVFCEGGFAHRVLTNSRPESPDPVKLCGLRVTVGPAYMLTD